VFELYARFLCSRSPFLHAHHASVGQRQPRLPPWQRAAAGLTRTVTFVQPRKPPSTCDTRCEQQQRLSLHAAPAGGPAQPLLLLRTSMRMLDIPFKVSRARRREGQAQGAATA
jgi:hypothetical protein